MERVLKLLAVGSKRYLTSKVRHAWVIHVSCVCVMRVSCVCHTCVMWVCHMCLNRAETASRGQQALPHLQGASGVYHMCVMCVCHACFMHVSDVCSVCLKGASAETASSGQQVLPHPQGASDVHHVCVMRVMRVSCVCRVWCLFVTPNPPVRPHIPPPRPHIPPL